MSDKDNGTEPNLSLRERVSYLEGTFSQLSTKEDLSEAKSELKSEDAQLRVDMSEWKSETLRWVIGTVVAAIAALAGIGTIFYLVWSFVREVSK